MLFADVILPLPLQGAFTYSVPGEIAAGLAVGQRVLVPFGRGKTYTGVISHLHNNAPAEGTPVKDILAVLDIEPTLRHPQLKFWQWIADYYLCSIGEVMRAALPAAMKVESETWLTTGAEEPVGELNETQSLIYAYLKHAKRQRLSDVAKGLKSFKLEADKAEKSAEDAITEDLPDAPLVLTTASQDKGKKGKEKQLSAARLHREITSLLDSGLLAIGERVADKYVTKKLTLVTLGCGRHDSDALHNYFQLITRSRAQEKLLVAYVDASGWMHPTAELKPVQKKALLEKSGASPAVFKAMVDKGIFKVEKKAVNRFSAPEDADDRLSGPELARLLDAHRPALSDVQTDAMRQVRHSMSQRLVTLLHGVTGSGKTEIYSHLIADTLSAGNQALMLVPEISLTTQLTERLRRIFGHRLIVYHSKFSDSERVDIWRRLQSGHEPMLILGVRSSVFLPFARLGLIVIDEEHESSYKQYDPAPRYNARDAAIMLATMHGSKVLLGSATPSVETYYKAKTGKYGLVTLTHRYGDMHLPEVETVDMRQARKDKQVTGPFSARLLSAVRGAGEVGSQAILFQNRRGFAPLVICTQCGWTPKCQNCDVSMVYHKHADELRCHYCGHTAHLPAVCPACGGATLRTWGYGTERLSDTLHELLPTTTISRMDLDTTRNKDAYERIIGEFSRGETQVLVGTQMVSKGLDFAGVTLVGIVNADTLLNFPDFRSDERAFNMMEQVSGRAGRRDKAGRVIVQTTNPDHHVITSLKAHDYTGFYEREIEQRRQFGYPPFTKVVNIYLRHKDVHILDDLVLKYTNALRAVFGTRVLGPESPYVGRVASYYIRTLMLKVETGASMARVKELLRQVEISQAREKGFSSLRLHYDVDPA